MPVQTRQQAIQAADRLPYSLYAGSSASVAARLSPAGELPYIGMSSTGLDPGDPAHLTANTPQTAGRSVRRKICEASPSDEEMVADMQAFEQQMVEIYQHHPDNLTEANSAAQQRDLMSLQREAEALQDAEAMIQQDLEVAAEIAELGFCSDRLQQAAEFILKPSRFQSLSPTDLNKIISAASHLLSVCQNAKDTMQQAELQNLRQDLQQLRTLNQVEQMHSLEVQRENRYAQQKNA